MRTTGRCGGLFAETLVFGPLASVYLALGQLYWQPVASLAKPEEALHLVVVVDIRRGTLWPIAQFSSDPQQNPFELDQRCQPPLYYWLTALVTLPSKMPWLASWASPNPYFLSGIPYANGARYISLKPLAESVAPARMWSLLLGCLTLAATCRMARGWTDRATAGVMALTAASLSSVLFAPSGVSNLSLAAPLHAVALMVLVIGVWRRGASPGRMATFSILLIGAITRPAFRRNSGWALLLAHAGGLIASSILGGSAYVAGGPRYIGSYGVSWILLWVGGLIGLVPRAGRKVATVGAYAALAALHLLVLTTTMWPVYVPQRAAASDVAAGPLARFGEGIMLQRAELVPTDGSRLTWQVRLWWQATRPPSDNYAVFIHATEKTGQAPVAQTDSYAVRGNYPTSWWPVGDVFVDEHVLPLTMAPTGPLPITAGLYQPFRQARLDVADPAGRCWRDDEVPIGAIP